MSLHDGVVRYAVVHATKNEGYLYWWNNGTLQQMLNLDDNYLDNLSIWLTYDTLTNEHVDAAFHLGQWRKKHIKLAWALLHILNAMHVTEHLPMLFSRQHHVSFF